MFLYDDILSQDNKFMTSVNNDQSLEFAGPVFLTGMPRSGTKLLRGLLNEHPRISIPDFETEFFPYWVKNWAKFSDLSIKSNFNIFYADMLKIPYFIYCKNNGVLIKLDDWYDSCKMFTPAGVFEALLRHDVKANFDTNIIWGDKSPSYIISLDLIKQQFPDAKFIHIIRDVRDYCLSINHAWNKSMPRAAQRWCESIEMAQNIAKSFPDDYIEVFYENLLDNPELEAKRICSFLNIPYDSSMLKISRPTENIGSTKGASSVVSGNKMKYEKNMPLSMRNKIEAISFEMLRKLGYPVSDTTQSIKLTKLEMAIYKYMDGYNLLVSTIKRIGPIATFKYVFGSLIISNK